MSTRNNGSSIKSYSRLSRRLSFAQLLSSSSSSSLSSLSSSSSLSLSSSLSSSSLSSSSSSLSLSKHSELAIYDNIINDNESSVLLEYINNKVKRKRYQSDHFDHVISNYREFEYISNDNTKVDNIISRISQIVIENSKINNIELLSPHIIDLAEDGMYVLSYHYYYLLLITLSFYYII